MQCLRGKKNVSDLARNIFDKVKSQREESNANHEQSSEDFEIVCLHIDINNYSHIKDYLCKIVISFKTFNDIDGCVKHLSSVQNKKIFLITSNIFVLNILPLVYNIEQLQYIYVYDGGEGHRIEIEEKYKKKISDIFYSENALVNKLADDISSSLNYIEIPMSILCADASQKPIHDLDDDSKTFLWHQFLFDALLHVPSQSDIVVETIIDHCRMEYSEETEEFKKIEYFYRNYDSREALWWYTHDTFIYRQLNAAMRLKDLNKIFLFREFIIDIHTQLLKLHSNMIMADNVDERRGNQSLLTIYKAQYMEVNKVQNLVKNIGNLLSVDTYLFTTNEKKTAMSFFRNNKNCQLTPFSSILFEFNIDIHVVTKPYANILVTDDKYLISMGTVFRITSATVMPETDIWIVKLDLSSEETRQLKKLGDYYKCQISTKAKTTDSIAYEAMKTFGDFLVTLKEYTKAEIYYNNILKYLPTNYPLLAQIYNKIGKIYWYKNDANNSLKLHSKALQICENSTPCNYLLVAKTYSYIGRSYSLKNDNMMALISHKTSLEIQQKYANYEHIDFVEPLNNMGEILTKIGDYSAALVNLEKALDICLNVSPSNYLLLSTTYNNIGWLHLSAGDYSKALVSFNKMSEYECNFLPKNSSSFGTTYNLLGYVHYLTGDNTIALLYYLKALDVYSKCYPSMKHWSVAEVYRNIGQVYFKQLDYSKSLEMYDKAFDIYQKYGWNSFQDSIQFLRGYSQIYNAKQQFRKALKYTNKALEIQLEHVPSDFIAISSTYTSIGQIYRQIGDNLNSSEYFKLALRTLLKVKNNINIVILVQAYCNVATALFSTGEYDSALSHFQLALDVYTNECQDSISLSDIYNLMGVINQKNGDYESALKLHEKALEQETDSTKIEAIYNEIGTIYCKICKYDEALNNIKKGLEQKEKEMSSSSYYQLALIYCKTKTGTII